MKLRGTTPVPNFFLDKSMAKLAPSSIRVYLKIIRNTLGWRDENGNVKRKDWISHSQFAKVGVSSRSVTSAIDELLSAGLIQVTDYLGNSLTDPQKRKLAKRIYYSPVVDNMEYSADDKAKTSGGTPQILRPTKEILQKKYNANERIPDGDRLNQILEEEQRKQIKRDGWLYN